MKIINLFGAPGAGKSTAAMGLIHEMKKRYHKSEYVSEYAKDLLWSGSHHLMLQQNMVLAEQSWRQERLASHGVDYAVTDSPLLLSSFYAKKYLPEVPDCFHELVRFNFNQFENVNFFIHRSHPYEPSGRLQNEQESDLIADEMLSFLKNLDIDFFEINAGDELPLHLLRHLNLDWQATPN